MAIKDIEGRINVVEAAKKRIQNVFDTGLPIKFSISGGKDSICLSHLIYSLIQEGKIDPKQMTVQFIDEEAIFDDVEQVVKDWRMKFMLVGAKFEWYCIQVKHFNCLNTLSDDETFITWDEFEKDKWVRPIPKFAIKSHPQLKPRKDTYQDFLSRINAGCIQLVGIRASESLMRRRNIGTINANKKNDAGINSDNSIFPIYDFTDDDIWLYIKLNHLDFPMTYLHIYQTGGKRRDMRISQFFSVDTAKVLVKLNEHQPGLMQRVIKREPNAYLASMYWESEMFRRSSKPKKNSVNNVGDVEIDYKAKVTEKVKAILANPPSQSMLKTAKSIKRVLVVDSMILKKNHYKQMYQILEAGDPKGRALRGLLATVATDYYKE